MALLAGTDFFTAEVLTLRGLVTCYVLFFIHLESRRVDIAGITVHPDELWMKQIAQNATMDDCGARGIADTSCTTETPNSPDHSVPSLFQARSNRWRCLRAVRT